MRAFALLLCLAIQPKPHRVVVGVTAPGMQVYQVVLGNVENIRKDFAPEPVEVEIVCYASGIDMLLKNPRLAKRMEKLSKEGVTFAACANTVKARKIPASSMYKFVRIVPSGAAEVVRKQEAGWSYLKGGF